MYLSLDEAKEEIERILKAGRNVFESVCSLTTFSKSGQVGNKLHIEIIYSPAFSKKDEDDIKRKVQFSNPEKKGVEARPVNPVTEQKVEKERLVSVTQ